MATVTEALDTLKMTRTLKEKSGDMPGALTDAYKTAEAVLTPFASAVAKLDKDETLTLLGKQARRRTLTDPLIQTAERFDSDANTIESATTTDAARVLADELRAPEANSFAAVADVLRQQDILRRLEGEDVVIRRLIVTEAARRGGPRDMELVRAALGAYAPLAAGGSKWARLLPDDAIAEAKTAIIERRSPQGPNAQTAMELRGLARQLRKIAMG